MNDTVKNKRKVKAPGVKTVDIGINYEKFKFYRVGDIKFSFQKVNHTFGNGMWLIANGQAIPKEFKDAIALLGNNVPDLSGRALAMSGTPTDGAGNNHLANSKAGSDTITLKTEQMPRHNHTGSLLSGSTQSGGNHTHNYVEWISKLPKSGGEAGCPTDSKISTTTGTGAHVHDLSGVAVNVSNEGSSQAHDNIQPTYYVENIFIYCE